MADHPRAALALGSGGARGYAHIGAIQVLEERGIEIVTVAGSSMGALVGGLYAAGKLDGFKESVQRMVGALIQGYILAKTPADKKKALQAFQDGLAIYKEAHKDAQQVIGTVFK